MCPISELNIKLDSYDCHSVQEERCYCCTPLDKSNSCMFCVSLDEPEESVSAEMSFHTLGSCKAYHSCVSLRDSEDDPLGKNICHTVCMNKASHLCAIWYESSDYRPG